MEVATVLKEGVLIITLNGRLDILSCKDFGTSTNALIEAGHQRVALDLAGLSYVSSAGLRVLLQARKTLKARGGILALCCANDFVREIMDTTGFTSIFPFYASVDEAVHELQQTKQPT